MILFWYIYIAFIHSIIQEYPVSFQRAMVNIKQNNAPLFRAKKSLFEIFKKIKSLYYRGLYTFFVQYTTPKDISLNAYIERF